MIIFSSELYISSRKTSLQIAVKFSINNFTLSFPQSAIPAPLSQDIVGTGAWSSDLIPCLPLHNVNENTFVVLLPRASWY